MVSGGGVLAIIRLQNAPRLYGTLAEIEREFYDAIARLRLHPAGGPVSRELWLYSRYGVLRFFRVEDAGIMEIGADGKVLTVGQVIPAPVGRAGSGKIIPETTAPEGTIVAVAQEPLAEESPGGEGK
jgi:hypothetical protein